jgi:two-component system cell cycle response regulator
LQGTGTGQSKILVIDPHQSGWSCYASALNPNFVSLFARNYNEAKDLMKRHSFDLLVLRQSEDVNLQVANICVETRKQEEVGYSFTGIIVVTDNLSSDNCTQLFTLGANQICPHNQLGELLGAYALAVSQLKLRHQKASLENRKLKVANSKLSRLSYTDDLSGLYNMRYIKQRLAEEYVRSVRYQHTLAIIMIDVDHFKAVNDNADHLLGSYVLSKIGEDIKAIIRLVDIAARYGGDEFIIVTPETDLAGAEHMARRLQMTIGSKVYDNGVHQAQVTISQGIAAVKPSNFPDLQPKEVMRIADQALYAAKEGGRNCIVTKTVTHDMFAHRDDLLFSA